MKTNIMRDSLQKIFWRFVVWIKPKQDTSVFLFDFLNDTSFPAVLAGTDIDIPKVWSFLCFQNVLNLKLLESKHKYWWLRIRWYFTDQNHKNFQIF
jgi:hypothetical protein